VLYPKGKSPQYPLERRVGSPQSWPGHGGEEEIPIIAPPTVIRPIAQFLY